MRSLSVTTTRRTPGGAAARRTEATWPRCSGVIHTPRPRRKMWLNSAQASPTVGV